MGIREKKRKIRTRTENQKVRSIKDDRFMVSIDEKSYSLIDCTDALAVEVRKLEFITEALAPHEEVEGAGFVLDGVVMRLRRIENNYINLIKAS